MDVRIKSEDRTLTICLCGDMDHHGARGLMEQLDRLLERAPLALRGIKAIVSHAIVDGNIEAAHEVEKKLSIYLMSTDDFKEAVSAFEEHRKPEFQGK